MVPIAAAHYSLPALFLHRACVPGELCQPARAVPSIASLAVDKDAALRAAALNVLVLIGACTGR